MIYKLIAIVAYLGVVVGVVLLFERRKRKRLQFFAMCFILTPIAGLIKVLVKRFRSEKVKHSIRYYCERCDFGYLEYQEFCPLCLADGHKVSLKRRVFKPYRA
jgi:hypothetical protein